MNVRKFTVIILISVIYFISVGNISSYVQTNASASYIKWVDFKVTQQALNDAMKIDIETYGSDEHLSWIDLLVCLALENGGDFHNYKTKSLDKLMDKLNNGETIQSLTESKKIAAYYKEAYTAVLGGMVGEFELDGEKKYGLKAFSPIAKGYNFSHFDDFGSSRSYGYNRNHLGHDLMGSIGTPIIAVEAGYVEAEGWNQYGGWRIGIRSFDGKRYYYYAHLRKNHPYNDIYEGKIVNAGEVIGYMGMTGYSRKENVNNINIPHLHYGLQLIFNPVQKDGTNQIWIDMYELTKFLNQNRSEVYKDSTANEYYSKHIVVDPYTPD